MTVPVQHAAPPLRDCRGCPQVDDHPRIAYGDHEVALGDDTYRKEPNYWHYDCAPPEVLEELAGPLPESEIALLKTIVAHSVGEEAEHFHGAELREKAIELRAATPLPVTEDESHG